MITDPAGRLKWVSPALPGSIHDLTAARAHGIIDALSRAEVMTFTDKGYQGAGGSVRTPFKRHHRRPRLSRRQRDVNRNHAKIGDRRARHRHPQVLEAADQVALPPEARHRPAGRDSGAAAG